MGVGLGLGGGWLWHINLWGCWPGLVLLILVGGGLPVLGPGLFAVGVFVCLFCCAFIWVWSVVCSDAGLFWSVALFWCVVAIE